LRDFSRCLSELHKIRRFGRDDEHEYFVHYDSLLDLVFVFDPYCLHPHSQGMISLRPHVFCLLTILPIVSCGESPPLRPSQMQAPRAEPLRIASIPRTPPPAVAAESVLVVDVASGQNLYAKNADSVRAVASTQKIITALCVIDAGNIDKPVTIAAYDAACEPTKLYLKPGESYTRRELLKVLMVKSANDVARALARDIGGSVEGFATLMNRKCAQLGMRNSNFMNPHGLTEPGQYSTARDMAIAARAAYRSPLLRSFAATKEFTFTFNSGRTLTIANTNRLLKTLPFVDGLKTGTTNASGRCLISSGSMNGRSVICVVLKSNTPNIWSDSEKLLRWSLERPAAE
jgi:serine-type D-Ala-D-Ala carboxypeptidase (penicillin-binding protein 5/6)